MRDEAERKRLKKFYIQSWLAYKAAHPDMPTRDQFGYGPFSKQAYRKAKDEWNRKNSDISNYLARRFMTLMEKGRTDLADLYSQIHTDGLKRGLATLEKTPKLDASGAGLTHGRV